MFRNVAKKTKNVAKCLEMSQKKQMLQNVEKPSRTSKNIEKYLNGFQKV